MFEMAQQLSLQGQKVVLLVNFNGISPLYGRTVAASRATGTEEPNIPVNKRKLHFQNIKRLGLKGKILYIAQRSWIKAKSKLLGPLFLLNIRLAGLVFRSCLAHHKQVPAIFARRYTANLLYLAQCNYRPKPYLGDMAIFRSPQIYDDPDLGWRMLIAGRISVFDVPGDHKSRRDILASPHVDELAELLKALLL